MARLASTAPSPPRAPWQPHPPSANGTTHHASNRRSRYEISAATSLTRTDQGAGGPRAILGGAAPARLLPPAFRPWAKGGGAGGAALLGVDRDGQQRCRSDDDDHRGGA